jgi:hypothetical protein
MKIACRHLITQSSAQDRNICQDQSNNKNMVFKLKKVAKQLHTPDVLVKGWTEAILAEWEQGLQI